MKKAGVLLIIVLILFNILLLSNYVNAQPEEPQIPDELDIEKWDYLGQKWKESLLNNPVIETIDTALRKINFLFVFFFAEDYDLSLTLLFAILLWVFFFVIFGRTLAIFATFSKWVSWIIAFGLVMILAHLGTFEQMSILLFKVIFYRDGIWGWISFGFFLFIFFVILIFLERIIWQVGRWFIKKKEDKEKWDEKFERQIFRIKMEGFENAFKEIGGAMK